MNVKLLRKVKRHILAVPKRLFMNTFVKTRGTSWSVLEERFPPCGTVACIAGWCAVFKVGAKEAYESNPREIAMKELNLTPTQADILFEPYLWPDKFVKGCADDGKLRTAKIAAARIEHFIKTEGKE